MIEGSSPEHECIICGAFKGFEALEAFSEVSSFIGFVEILKKYVLDLKLLFTIVY